jgi:hypothetical protein
MATGEEVDRVSAELDNALNKGKGPAFLKFALAVVSGVASSAGSALGGAAGAPDVGGVIGSAAGGIVDGASNHWSDREQGEINSLFNTWLKLQEAEMREIGLTMAEVVERLDMQDETIKERLQSPEYLNLLKKCFRDWSAAESEEKRKLVRNLLVSAAASHITTDDVVRLFVDWIDQYSDLHFKTIRAVYNHDGITRRDMWLSMYQAEGLPREDSPEADLFKLVIQDLNLGHIIRQHRAKDSWGNFIKAAPRKGVGNGYTSAFDPIKQYELTELGKQFVHYAMSEYTVKLGASAAEPADNPHGTKPPAPIVTM